MVRLVLLGFFCSAYTGRCVALVKGSCGVVLCGYRGGLECVGISDVLFVYLGDFLCSLLQGNYSCAEGVVAVGVFLLAPCLRYCIDVF